MYAEMVGFCLYCCVSVRYFILCLVLALFEGNGAKLTEERAEKPCIFGRICRMRKFFFDFMVLDDRLLVLVGNFF